MIPARLVSGRTDPVLSLDEVKVALRIDHPHEDSLITGLVEAATDRVEAHLRLLLGEQVWEQSFPRFSCRLVLPLAPLLAVEEIRYVDEAGTQQTVSSGAWRIDPDLSHPSVLLSPGVAWPRTADRPDAVEVEFRAGQAPVRPAILGAIRMLTGTYYQHRQAGGDEGPEEGLPAAVRDMLAPYRRFV